MGLKADRTPVQGKVRRVFAGKLVAEKYTRMYIFQQFFL